MPLHRTNVSLAQRIMAPAVRGAMGAICMTCGRRIDSELLVEGEPGKTTFAKVLAKHHGAEELRTFDMGSVEWDDYELKSHMMRANWFSPHGEGDAGLGVKVNVPMDADDEPSGKAFSILGVNGKPIGS